jgi:Mor family transcriptional regulator
VLCIHIAKHTFEALNCGRNNPTLRRKYGCSTSSETYNVLSIKKTLGFIASCQSNHAMRKEQKLKLLRND